MAFLLPSKPLRPRGGPSEPPIELASQAASAREFIKELQERKLSTIRQRIRAHKEQTWEGAVTAMRGANLPPHPTPPAGSEPTMQVQVPCRTLDGPVEPGRLASGPALRRRTRQNGRLWFNDYPYGILAAETYMVLAALDLMGSHQAAEDGFDQWVSLPHGPQLRHQAITTGRFPTVPTASFRKGMDA